MEEEDRSRLLDLLTFSQTIGKEKGAVYHAIVGYIVIEGYRYARTGHVGDQYPEELLDSTLAVLDILNQVDIEKLKTFYDLVVDLFTPREYIRKTTQFREQQYDRIKNFNWTA